MSFILSAIISSHRQSHWKATARLHDRTTTTQSGRAT